MPSFFDLDGNPVGVDRWAEIADMGTRMVGLDTVGDRVVSTVWLGVDAEARTPPLIFETIVFFLSDAELPKPIDGWTRRYPTAELARVGHVETVGKLRNDAAGGAS